MHPRVLAISGSRRRESISRRLLAEAARIAEATGAKVTVLDWDRYHLPLYDGDLEAECGPPAPALRLKRLVAKHDGLIIATPEYNASVTPLLKNAIDWASRPGGPERVFAGRPVALLGVSPGPSGGRRGLRHLKDVLSNLDARVQPEQFALEKALKAYDPETGRMPPPHRHALEAVIHSLLNACFDVRETDELQRA